MSQAKKEKPAPVEEPPTAARELEDLLAAVEERTERLAARVQSLAAENGRLRAALEETAAERDRLQKDVAEKSEGLGKLSAAEERISLLEDERDGVRARIEKLVAALESAANGADPEIA